MIGYRDVTDLDDLDLRVAVCHDSACTDATSRTIDRPGAVGAHVSLAIDKDGDPVMSYYDSTNDDLKFAACVDPTCTSAVLTTVDDKGEVGRYSSLAIDTDDRPIISYFDDSHGDLKVAHILR